MRVVNENSKCLGKPEPFKPVTIVLETEREYYDLSAALCCVDYDLQRHVLKVNNKDERMTRQLKGVLSPHIPEMLQRELFDMMAPFTEQHRKKEQLLNKENM